MFSHVARLWKSTVSDGAFAPFTPVEGELCVASARRWTSSESTFTPRMDKSAMKTVETIVIIEMIAVMTTVETLTSDD
tara:strand:- start:1453 stop:1686 length:234 start_codon:yes stop_codon:yes gene_type:complete